MAIIDKTQAPTIELKGRIFQRDPTINRSILGEEFFPIQLNNFEAFDSLKPGNDILTVSEEPAWPGFLQGESNHARTHAPPRQNGCFLCRFLDEWNSLPRLPWDK
jgi:hypothetical protein